MRGAVVRRAMQGADADETGVWSEFMIFDGVSWVEERCQAAMTLCALLRESPEVAGDAVTEDGEFDVDNRVEWLCGVAAAAVAAAIE